jgi:ABC-2 type transport system permease protein
MNKLWLIVKREYLSRVAKKAFIFGTILTPLGIGALIFMNIKLATYKDDNSQNIVIRDESGILTQAPENQPNIHFTLAKEPLEDLKMQVVAKKYDGVLVIPRVTDPMAKKFTLKYYSDDKLGEGMSNDIEDKVAESIKKYKINALQLDTSKIAALKTRIEIDPDPIVGTKNASSISGKVGMLMGIAMGFVMYLVVLIYGMMIFRSVMEEKTSRIVEVMISSVRPFQLMMGKILGVGAVGFTQIIIWVALTALITTGIAATVGQDAAQQMASNPQMQMAQGGAGAGMATMKEVQASGESATFLAEFQNQNWGVILPLFFVYFLLGYFMYAALYAAIGSAVGDDQGEAQSLAFPIMIPIILAIYIMITAVRAPESSLAVWSSIFPLFSPIVMPARLPFGPPAWQVALSITLLVATVIGLVALAGRIYRVGILMYGKKVTFKELGKWLFYKD